MVTVTWTGTFESSGCPPVTTQLTFSGEDLKEIDQQIKEHVDDMEDNAENEWILGSSGILNTVYS